MKHWLLVDKQSLQIVNRYDSETPNAFGGPWGDSLRYMHLECPQALSSKANLAIVHENTVVDTQYVPCMCAKGNPVYKEAYDRSGNLIISPKGHPLYAQLFERVEIYGLAYVVKEYSA